MVNLARKKGVDIQIKNIGQMMYEKAEEGGYAIEEGKILDLPEFTLRPLRWSVLEDVLRTIDEAAGVPVKEAHAVSYRSAKWIFDVVRAQKITLDNEETSTEERITELEVRAIMDRILELGEGDVAVGYERGVQTGAIDCPLASNVNLKSKVLGIRDNQGACRYLDFGNLPIPEEAKEFHREKVAEREKLEGRKMDLRVVIEDFWAFSKGRIKGEPAL